MLGALTPVLAGSRNHALDRVDRATAALRQDIDRREQVEAQLRLREEQLRHLADHDPLTGLVNRAPFYERVDKALAGDRMCAVLFLDLDGFKQINDRYGHGAGDLVLTTVADRLRAGLRATDLPARLGGDEFAVLLDGITTGQDARAAADRILAALSRPVDIGVGLVTVGGSIGIAIREEGATAEHLLRAADTAMYEAKAGGKNRYAEAAPPSRQ